jgi:glucose-6-phosphate dehydrogenase assembly protein OpcA
VTDGSGAVSEAVARVEAQLSAFWSSTKDESGATKARAATMNFVVASVPSEVQALRGAIEDLSSTRAGRSFLMTIDGHKAPWEVDSDVAAVCHKEGETVICYDRVELHFGAMAAARAPSVLSALALSEVPTILEIARGAPAVLADGLARRADRVIVDSAHTTVGRIAEIAGKTAAPLADRAFVRTFSWREFAARFFDEAPGAEHAVGRVEVERVPDGHRDPAALFLGWLASRLGWRFEGATRARDATGMPISVAVSTPSHGSYHPGEIAAVRLVTAIDGRPLFCSCERHGEERVVRWKLEGPRTVEHQHPIGFRDEGWVLGKAIDSVEADQVYRAAVLAGAQWAHLAEIHR